MKCINCVANRGIGALESEWARYKYCVLERSPEHYQAIRQLLREKHTYPALEMYRRIEASFDLPVVAGNGVNTAQHVWGYFKDKASGPEKRRFQILLDRFTSGETGDSVRENPFIAPCGKISGKTTCKENIISIYNTRFDWDGTKQPPFTKQVPFFQFHL